MMGTMAIFIGVGFVAILVCGMLWVRSRERADWNGGICTECPGSKMVHFDYSSQGCRGYRCDECHRRIWISYRVDK